MTNTPGSEVSFIIAQWCDFSLSTGYSINERESTMALLDQYPSRIRVVCPEPAFPEVFSDSRIQYIYNHQRHSPYHYCQFTLAFRRTIQQLLVQEPAAVVVFRLGPLPLVPAEIVRDGTPVIIKKLERHQPTILRNRERARRLAGAAGRALYRYITANCLGADVESHSYAEWLPTQLPIARSKITVIPNGANTDRFSPQDRAACRRTHGWDRFRYLIGYVGAIDALRHPQDALTAMRLLRDVPDLGLVLVGDGALAPTIREQIHEEGLSDRVILPGFLPYTDVPSVINAFDVAIDLSLVPFRNRDGVIYGSYSQKVAQYLACGIPVVAWETIDTVFLDENGIGRTVPVGDTKRLAMVLRELISEAPARKRIARATSRKFACSELSTDVLARRRMQLWSQLAEQGRE
jgi:glycosyltransferase involved in cell wall biosynthesis